AELPRYLQTLRKIDARRRIVALHSGKTGRHVERLSPVPLLPAYFRTRQHRGEDLPPLANIAIDFPEPRQSDGQTQAHFRAIRIVFAEVEGGAKVVMFHVQSPQPGSLFRAHAQVWLCLLRQRQIVVAMTLTNARFRPALLHLLPGMLARRLQESIPGLTIPRL